MSLWQHGTQANSSKQAKTTFYQILVWLPTWLESFEHSINKDNKQTFSGNTLCSGCRRHLLKLVISCRNEKVGKSRKEINNILYHLLAIFLIIKVKVGLNLHFLFISCKLSVYNMSYNPIKSSDFGWFFVNFPLGT